MLVWRYVRQRRVLALIFGSSLLYFLVKTDFLPLSSILEKRHEQRDDDKYFESQRLRAPKSIEWQSADKVNNETDLLESGLQRCRYTKQGKRWVVDEFGFFCDRYQLTPLGCCRTSPASRFVCTTCDTRVTHCCATYEHCVSCCLQPTQRPLLETVIRLTNGSRLRALLMSVYQENKYKSPKTKYCYGPEPKLPYTR